MRLFIAIELAGAVRARIDEMCRELEPRLSGARFVTPENLHLSLRFLGETKEKTLPRVREGLAAAGSGYTPFGLKFRGIGFFPHPRRPRILWVGAEAAPESLFRIQEKVEALARECGFAPEPRPFSPHITLARFKEPHPCPGCPGLVETLSGRDFGESPVESLTLFESRLHPSGARYQAMGRFSLKANRPGTGS